MVISGRVAVYSSLDQIGARILETIQKKIRRGESFLDNSKEPGPGRSRCRWVLVFCCRFVVLFICLSVCVLQYDEAGSGRCRQRGWRSGSRAAWVLGR